jgi:hypothetical protein
MTRALVAGVAGIVLLGGSLFVLVGSSRRSYSTYLILRIIFGLVFAVIAGLLLRLLLRAH